MRPQNQNPNHNQFYNPELYDNRPSLPGADQNMQYRDGLYQEPLIDPYGQGNGVDYRNQVDYENNFN